MVNEERVKWAVGSFEAYKSPGVDEIFPKLLNKALPWISSTMVNMKRFSLPSGRLPGAWETTKVVCIPKTDKTDYTTPKSFRPICLLSNVLKTMERLVDRYIKDEYLEKRPLHRFQHAFRTGRSVEVVVHHFVKKVEIAKKEKLVTLACFVDIEGTFNRTPTEVIINALRKFANSDTIVGWIKQMLTKRKVQTSRGDATASGMVNRECPQGGILSPLLWSLVVDDLLYTLENCRITTSA